MVKLQWKSALLLSFVLLLGSCKMSETPSVDEPQGTVRISTVGFDQTIASTRIATEDLSLRIENTRGEVLRTWEKLIDVPEQIRVVTGSYKLVAWAGDTSLMPSFVDMYYEGSEKFAVTAGETVSVPLVVKVGVTKVKVEFDAASFAEHYSAYSADLRTTTAQNPDSRVLNFMPSTTEAGNFMPGTLRIRMRLTSKSDGKEYLFYPSPIPGLNAAESRTVTLKVTPTSGHTSLVVTTDDGYEKVEEITLELPASALPKPAPIIRANSFTVGGVIEGTEGYVPSTKFASTIIAQAGIKSVIVRTTSPIVTTMWGGRNEIEIVGANSELRNLLTATGFVWDESLNSAETAAARYGRTEISYAQLFDGLSTVAGSDFTDYPFEIEVIDMFNQSNKNLSTGLGRFYFNVRVNKPDFGWVAVPTAGNVWSSHAEFDVKYMSNTAKKPNLWIKEGEGAWVIAPDQTFLGEQGEPTLGVITVKELKPSTQYSFRLKMGNHLSDEFTTTTEELATVENGDMETWQAKFLGTWPHDVPYYQPYAAGGNQYWVTNNDRTTSYNTGITTYGYNCFPAVSYTLSAANGKFSAELRTTSASNIDPLNAMSTTQSHSQVPGMLYIGTFNYQKPNDVVAYGKPFVARPSKMSFLHTYVPYNSDSFSAEVILYNQGRVIGQGEYVSPTAVNSYTLSTVDITYSDRRSRADAMTIIFKSSATGNAVRKVNSTIDLDMVGASDGKIKGWSAFIGSILRIDDVAVSY